MSYAIIIQTPAAGAAAYGPESNLGRARALVRLMVGRSPGAVGTLERLNPTHNLEPVPPEVLEAMATQRKGA